MLDQMSYRGDLLNPANLPTDSMPIAISGAGFDARGGGGRSRSQIAGCVTGKRILISRNKGAKA
jgi:hypothetical protein